MAEDQEERGAEHACPDCGKPMRRLGIEAHPLEADMHLHSFECSSGHAMTVKKPRAEGNGR